MCGRGDTGPVSVSRCFLKLGEWQLNLQGINESTIPKVLQYYSAATEHDRGWYKVTAPGRIPAPRPPLGAEPGCRRPVCPCLTAEPRSAGPIPGIRLLDRQRPLTSSIDTEGSRESFI